MDKKPTGPKGPAPVTQETPVTRHRFGESEKTMIMPLAELLKARDASSELPGSETVVTPPPSGAPRPPKKSRSSEQPPAVETDFKINTRLTHKLANVQEALHGSAAPTPTPKPAPQLSEAGDTRTTEASPLSPASTRGGPAKQEAPAASTDDIEEMLPPSMQAAAPAAPAQARHAASPASAARAAEPQLGGQKNKDAAQRNGVIVFFSCKGGSGATTLTSNVAHTYAKSGLRTCVVDLDLQLGDALAALGLQPRAFMAQALATLLRGETMEKLALPQHASGVKVLSQVGSLDDLDKVTSEHMVTLIEGLRGAFDTVVVDGVRDFSDNVLAVLDVADRIAIVTVQEVLAIRRARWTFGILRKIGFDPKEIAVVVNRFDAESEISYTTLSNVFEPGRVIPVPNENKLVLQSLNRGVPLQDLNPTHTLTRNIVRLANALLTDSEVEVNEATAVRDKKKGSLGRLAFWRRKK